MFINMKKTILKLLFVVALAVPAISSADTSGWYGDDYSYDSGSWYGDDYSYDYSSWYGDDYSYDYSSWYGDDYSYDYSSWYGDDYSYDYSSWYGDDYSYEYDNWYGDDYDYEYSNWYGDDYEYTDYSSWYGDDYDYDVDYAYDYDYDYDYDYGYDYTDYSDWYSDYDYDYDYSDYDYGCRSNCGSYNPPCRTNCNPVTPKPKPQPKTLNVICIPSDRNIEEGESVTFEAEVTGGTPPYTYRWTGDVSSTSRTVTRRFDHEGTYRVIVTVTDKKGRTASDECDIRVEDEDEDEDFDAICVPAKSTIDRGERITFKARVEGGDRPYEYDWSGDADGDDEEIRVRFEDEGRYTIHLKVTDDEGRVARDTCEVKVRDDDDDDDRDINVITDTIPHDTFSSVGSVYLNQVPYTGPEDWAKGAAFVGILLAWSAAGAMILKKRKAKAEVSDRIAAFKEANRTAKA